MSFHNLSCLDTIICYTNTIGIVPAYACNVCDALVASCTTAGLTSMRQNGRPALAALCDQRAKANSVAPHGVLFRDKLN